VEEVVNAVCKAWGEGRWVLSPDARRHEAHWLRLDASRAALELGWRPLYDTEGAISKTVAWYRKFYGDGPGPALLEYSVRDLHDYMDAQGVTP